MTVSAARERLLHTAHDLFYAEGLRAIGVDRIIAEAGVTKVTFYRHFPSKNDLILAYLDYRHARWMAWFTGALARNGGMLGALVPALEEWFRDPGFRGCAFLNSVSDIGPALPEVQRITLAHKSAVEAVLADLLPPGPDRAAQAQALCVAMDGAIVRASFEPTPEIALSALARLVAGVTA